MKQWARGGECGEKASNATFPGARTPSAASRTRAERVEYVAMLMATGEFRRGKTAKELTVMWGLSLQSVAEICAEASRAVQCSVNVADVLRTLNETIDELLSIGHDCKNNDMPREAIVAFSKVADLCVQVTRQRGAFPSGDENRLSSVQKLIEAGWTPPPPEGLPMPTLDDPEKELE
jgi:hypothetical protein